MPDVARHSSASLSMALAAAWALCRREVVRFFRQRNRVVGALVQPLVLWGVFGLGMHRSFQLPAAQGSASFASYFYPGVILLMVMFTAIFATISIIEDRREGFMQSVLIAPAPRWSMVLGKVMGGAIIATAQGLLLAALAAAAGGWPGVFSLLALGGLLFVAAFGLTALGVVIAWPMESTQGFHAIMNLLLMPMWLLSGAFFPVPAANDPLLLQRGLHWLMRCNPLSYAVSETRRLLYGGVPDGAWAPSAPTSWIAVSLFAILMFIVASRVAAARLPGASP